MNALRIALNILAVGVIALAAVVQFSLPHVPTPIAFFGCLLCIPALSHTLAIVFGTAPARAALVLSLASASLFLYFCLVCIIIEMSFRGMFVNPGRDLQFMLASLLLGLLFLSALLNTRHSYSALVRNES